MKSKQREINERIKLAREFCGLTKTDLSKKIEITKQALSAIENSIQNPSSEVIARIAEETRFPISFFITPKVVSEIDRLKTPITFRKYAKTTLKEQKQAKAIEEIISWIWFYLENQVELFKIDVPKIPIGSAPEDEVSIEDAAKEVRLFWHLGDGPISNLMALLENHGIRITRTKLADNLDAYSTWDSNTPIIIDKSTHSTALRGRFSLAHELGHLVLHSNITSYDFESIDKCKEIEHQANLFAGAFLMPSATFGHEFISTSKNYLSSLEMRWKCSVQSMAMRAHFLGAISDNQLSYIFRQIGGKAGILVDDRIEREEPRVMKEAISLILQSEFSMADSILESLQITAGIFYDITGVELGKVVESKILQFNKK